ncbi:MAG: LysM peptidoglycan-binding domain-containing protein [Bradymonadia bacterium]
MPWRVGLTSTLGVLLAMAAGASPPTPPVVDLERALTGPAPASRCALAEGCELDWFAAEDALAGRLTSTGGLTGALTAPPWRGKPLPDLSHDALGVTLNPYVEQFIDFFTGRGKSTFAHWYARMGREHGLITGLLTEAGLPADLIYVCMIESGFSPDAVSPAGAVGLWQFTENTGGAFQLKVDDWIDERRDRVKATRAAARYLKSLHQRFGSWPLALAAYNAGQGTVQKAINRHNTNDYWVLVDRGALPREASRYVPKIMAAQIIGRSPHLFGFEDVKPKAPRRAQTVSTPGGIDLEKLARRVKGLTFDELSVLNPELRRGFTPPYGDDYPLQVPTASAKAVRAVVSGGGKALTEYTVRFGERARDIARDHAMGVSAFRRLNDLGVRGEPSPGQTVFVAGQRSKSPRAEEALAVLSYVAPDLEFEIGDRQTVYLPIRWTMPAEDVARFFGVTVADIAMWNGLDPQVPLLRGMVVRLFLDQRFDLSTAAVATAKSVQTVKAGTPAASIVKAEAAKVQPAGTRYIEHTLVKGDRLWNLARAHDTTVDAIRAANGLGPKDRVKIGTALKIPTRSAPAPKGKARRRAAKPASARRRTHTVGKGDSLWKIARKYGVDVKDLKRRNKLKSDAVRRGQTLVIP